MNTEIFETRCRNAVTAAMMATPLPYLLATLGLHGASFNESAVQLLKWALLQDWVPYEHPAIQAPARGFIARRQGFQLVMPTGDLGPDDVITFDPLDEKSLRTGVVMGRVLGHTGPVVEHVVALIGSGADGREVLWTIHAGDPIRPSTLPANEWAGKTIGVPEACAMGVEYVRCGVPVDPVNRAAL